jgi:hypothetical protein
MDPFLESPDFFPDFHGSFLVHLKESLQKALPLHYFAKGNQRVWLEYSARYIEPDISIASNLPARRSPGTAVAVAEADPAFVVKVVQVPDDENSEMFVEIYIKRGSQNVLVTSIELLSPANKAPGEQGRDLYLQKQREVLGSKVNLVEIDFLRGGRHTTAVSRDHAEKTCGRFDYHVCVHRFDRPDDYLIYPAVLEQRLPRIEVPLLPEDVAVTLDLQEIFVACYDGANYGRAIDYSHDSIIPPLTSARETWAKSLLKSAER